MKIAGIEINDHDVPLWAMAASAVALLTALASQYLGGLAPCKLCLWQRIPHGVVLVLGVGALLWFRGPRERLLLTWAAAIAFAFGAGLALYHVGVEQKWWQGPDTCTSSSTDGLSVDQLLDQIMTAPLVRCDEIAWSLMGISMAGWNAIVSFALAFLWVTAFKRSKA